MEAFGLSSPGHERLHAVRGFMARRAELLLSDEPERAPYSYGSCCGECDMGTSPPTCRQCTSTIDECLPGESAARCWSTSLETTCEPTDSPPPYDILDLVNADPGAMSATGCCVDCEEDGECRACASAPHEACGKLDKARCGLMEGKFECRPETSRRDAGLPELPRRPEMPRAPEMPEPIPGQGKPSDLPGPASAPADAVPQN